MGRRLLGVIVGMIVAILVVTAAEALGQRAYPLPAGVAADPAALRALIHTLPTGAFAFVLGGWVLGAGLGSWAALRVSRASTLRPGLIVGTVVLVAAAYNVWTIPHPLWLVAAAVLGIPAATYLGATSGRIAEPAA